MNKTKGDLIGKICLVTGGSSGIGKVTALELAQLGTK
jgi:NAD(P)-dependent dehydrogenase (short-subunit alcohol dehydrogenase family)